jgi:hypothetical protein
MNTTKRTPLILDGESLVWTFRFNNALIGTILKTAEGYFRLREWDDVHGWGDRSYRTLDEAKYWGTH